jgi:hypothetical protein
MGYIDPLDENSSLLIGGCETKEDCSNHLRSGDFEVLLGAITIRSSRTRSQFKLLSPVEDSSDRE